MMVAAFFAGLGEVGSSRNGGEELLRITWNDLRVSDGALKKELENLGGENWRRMRRNGSRLIVVDQKGKGDVRTVQAAVDMVPQHNSKRVKIYIVPGIYREKVQVPASKPYISMIGDKEDPSRTVISWHDKASDRVGNGGFLGTSRTATLQVYADYFCASGITVENTVVATPGGEGMQAVAANINGDRAVFYKCSFLGSQDTLLDDAGNHYFYRCYIQGMVDFICGNARSLYQECVINSLGSGAIAAQHRNSPGENTGYSFVKCRISGNGKTLLGRAWGEFSTVVYANCDIEDVILPWGWSDWSVPSRQTDLGVFVFWCEDLLTTYVCAVQTRADIRDAQTVCFLEDKSLKNVFQTSSSSRRKP
ncbi:unnamed protein product [Cuscuta campestris]|uniref:pectinesterase n=1 Tax=Cuscuta campestris TaxID=132261 RepID=A0A484LHT7_9ASTE|nr:unnamed protein product [Cuscuta campestris]